MLDRVVESRIDGGSAAHRAETLLGAGIPLGLTVQAAATYVQGCQEVLDDLASTDSLLAIKLRAAQIIAPSALQSAQSDLDSAAAAADELRQSAERLGDPVALAYASAAWGMTRPGPEHTARRVRVANEILDVASRHDENALVPAGYALLLTGLLEQGEIRSLDTELLERRAAATARHGSPQDNPALWFRCLRLILDGDAEGAEQQAKALVDQSPKSGTVAEALYTTQLGMIRWMQGRVDGAEEGFLRSRREYPEQLLWPASLAWLWLLQGRRTSGETLLRSLPPLEEIPRDRYWLSTMTVLAEIARISGSRGNAVRLRELLLSYAAHLVPVGIGVSFWGTAARTLGLLEERLGLLEDARAHLELAIEMSARIGALAWHAEAQIELAEFGLRHDLTDVPSYDLLSEARRTAEARGFAALAQRAMHPPRIRVLGGFEVVSLCGKRAEWTSRKARELLKMLVAARGVATSREVFMDVLWPGEPPSSLSNRFSVAVNVIRRALDPEKMRPTQHHVVTEGDAVRLAVDHLDIDLERFLSLARRTDDASIRAASKLYRGAAFSEEPYADWAVEVRDHAEQLHRRLAESMDS